jgi:hypothetical protein
MKEYHFSLKDLAYMLSSGHSYYSYTYEDHFLDMIEVKDDFALNVDIGSHQSCHALQFHSWFQIGICINCFQMSVWIIISSITIGYSYLILNCSTVKAWKSVNMCC